MLNNSESQTVKSEFKKRVFNKILLPKFVSENEMTKVEIIRQQQVIRPFFQKSSQPNIVKPVALRPKKVDQEFNIFRLSAFEFSSALNLESDDPNTNRQSRFIDQRSLKNRKSTKSRSVFINNDNVEVRPHLNLIKMKVNNLVDASLDRFNLDGYLMHEIKFKNVSSSIHSLSSSRSSSVVSNSSNESNNDQDQIDLELIENDLN